MVRHVDVQSASRSSGPSRLTFCIAVLLAVFLSGAPDRRRDAAPQEDLGRSRPKERIRSDLRRIATCRNALRATLSSAASRRDLFSAERLAKARNLRRAQKEAVWKTWKSILDQVAALDSIGRRHGEPDGDSFIVAYAAFLAQYRSAIEFIDLAENDPGLGTILNEPVPEIGLQGKTYTRFKNRFLDSSLEKEFGALTKKYKSLDVRASSDLDFIREDADAIRKSAEQGRLLAFRHKLKTIGETGFAVWFPIQARVSAWMGDTKVHRLGRSLVSAEQTAEAAALLKPGDILLTRREWYVSNLGLPGFWPHSAIYIGTPEERRKFFDRPRVRAWVREQGRDDGSFEGLLQEKYPDAYALSAETRDHGHAVRVVEGVSEGIVFTTIEHAMEADSAAVLRPRLSRIEKAAALLRAFHYSGRPYDFNFDFLTDSTFTCSELIYKSYEPTRDTRGLEFELREIMGRLVITANDIARRFDADFGTPEQQMTLILFLDGHEDAGKAVEADVHAFRQSWKRPKWHIFTQEPPQER